MKKSETINTFTLGLIMDLNPISAPDDGVCNALNATIVTMNGNENVLLNDMGNGRVETAFLPEGYIPLGTTELGGIIYIVSYNPLTNKCLIGSFPSPERNIESTNNISPNILLSDNDFSFTSENGAKSYYIKKELENITFNPGDKFVVYGQTSNSIYNKLYDETKYNSTDFDKAIQLTLKLKLGSVTGDNRIIIFLDKDLKKFGFIHKLNDKPSEVKEINTITETTTEATTLPPSQIKEESIICFTDKQNPMEETDIDSYRSLVMLPYNIYNNKVSGKLVIIAELIQFDSFSAVLEHNIIKDVDEEENPIKIYKPNVSFIFESENPFIPKGVICKFTLYITDTEGKETSLEKTINVNLTDDIKKLILNDNKKYDITIKDILNYDKEVEESNIEESSILDIISNYLTSNYTSYNKLLLKCEFIPYMNWGIVQHLLSTTNIDFNKVGTGYIELNTWKYYKLESEQEDEPEINITWGFEAYEEDKSYIDSIELNFYRPVSKIDDQNYEIEIVKYTIDKKSSYHGIFLEKIPLNVEHTRLDKPLASNSLYLALFIVHYKRFDTNNKSFEDDPRYFYRWIYTNEIFNEHYLDILDFQVLKPEFKTKFTYDYATESESSTNTALGLYLGTFSDYDSITMEERENFLNTKSSISAIQTQITGTVLYLIKADLKNNYNTFSVKYYDNSYKFKMGDIECNTTSNISYTLEEDPNLNLYLSTKAEIVDDISSYILTSSTNADKSNEILNIPTFVFLLENNNINLEFKDNLYTLKISYKTLQTMKAYCTKLLSKYTLSGALVPLLNSSSYTYNLDPYTYLPSRIGVYSIYKEHNGNDTDWSMDYGIKINTVTDIQKIPLYDYIILKQLNYINWQNKEDSYLKAGWTQQPLFTVYWSDGSKEIVEYDDSIPLKYKKSDENIVRYSDAVTSKSDSKQGVRVELRMWSNIEDKGHIPINFSYSNINITDYDSLYECCSEMFLDFCSVLGNLYRYESRNYQVDIIRPNNIIYMDSPIYETKINFNIESNYEDNNEYVPTIYINIINDRILLKNYIECFNNINLENLKNINLTNLNYSILMNSPIITTNILNNDTSKESLRDIMLRSLNYYDSTIIFDLFYRDVIGYVSQTYDNTKIYYIDEKNSPKIEVKLAKNIPIYNIKIGTDVFGRPYAEKGDILEEYNDDYNRYFMISPSTGEMHSLAPCLILKDPLENDIKLYFDSPRSDDSAGYTKKIYLAGYLRAALLEKYKFKHF